MLVTVAAGFFLTMTAGSASAEETPEGGRGVVRRRLPGQESVR